MSLGLVVSSLGSSHHPTHHHVTLPHHWPPLFLNVTWSQYGTVDQQLCHWSGRHTADNNCVCVPFALIWDLVYSWPKCDIKKWSHIMRDWVTIVFFSLSNLIADRSEKNITGNSLPCKACPYCTRYPPPPRAIWSSARPWTGTRSSVSKPSRLRHCLCSACY